jgi:tetratricopeptide (TPR) repeat protein
MPKRGKEKSQRKQILVVSAGDLIEERKALPGVVRRFNASAPEDEKLALTQWHAEALPKRTLDISAFDLVVFLLWKQWGKPLGRYSSAFKRILSGAERAGLRCMLYFRVIPDADTIDPDEEISRIIAFRDGIERQILHTYFWYDDPDYWKKMFEDHLDRWIDGELPHYHLAADMSDHKKRLAGLIKTLGKTKSKQNVEAFRMALKAHDLAEKNRFTLACRQFARAIAAAREPYLINEYGIFLKKTGLWRSAEKVFEDLARMGQFMEDKMVIGSAMRHLGDINRRADRPDRADKFLRRAAAAERGQGRTLREAVIQQDRGMVHFKLGHLDMAQKLFSQALKMYEKAESIEGQAIIYFSLTGIHIEKADVVSAIHTSQKALELFRQIGADDMIDKLQTLLTALEDVRKG